MTTPVKDGAQRALPPDLPVRDWDRYEITEILGRGGMGLVYKAYDPRLKRAVALKFLRWELEEYRKRFIQEAQAQARIEHPNVCEIYEVGEVQGHIYIAMQYIKGLSLSDLKGRMTIQQKAQIIRDVAEGIHAAHRVGLIHRDIKPANILVEQREDGVLYPYVLDFGLVREVQSDGFTVTGVVLGTPFYMSPEQAKGETQHLDRRSDVYAPDATFYELLSGTLPFEGATGIDILLKVVDQDPVPLRHHKPQIPVDLETIVMKCLEKEPQNRYDSAKALAEDLQRYMDTEPILARPLSFFYRLAKRIKKQKLMFSVLAISLLIILLIAGIAWQISNAPLRRI